MADTRVPDKLDHVLRPALPWRPAELTECGRPANDFPVIDRNELADRVTRLGQQRTAFTVCMTCYAASGWAKQWETAPEAVLQREISRVTARPDLLRRELWAITALIAAHRSEFEDFVNGLADTPSLDAHRRNRRTGGSRG
jgi:hypothetical protein